MRDLLDDIDAALDAGLYFLALHATMSVPDICGALAAEDGQATGERFRRWFDENVTPVYTRPGSEPVLTGADCWRFRCALLHRGSAHADRSRYSRIVFAEPDGPHFFHQNVFNDALNLDLPTFCHDVTVAARNWLDASAGTEPFETNLATLVRRHPDGIPPYIVGYPLIG